MSQQSADYSANSICAIADTGAFKALLDTGDDYHDAVQTVLTDMPSLPLLTTTAVLTESLHLLHRNGWQAQKALWEWVDSGFVRVAELDTAALRRCAELMEKYRDLPADFADSSLVVVAERTGILTVLTLDSDFYIYRVGNGEATFVPRPGIDRRG